LLWAVQNNDFPDHDAVIEFLERREEVLKAAERVGMERDVFLPFEPSKPGFEDRVAVAFGAILQTVRHAAE
jgi:hypothetical protein